MLAGHMHALLIATFPVYEGDAGEVGWGSQLFYFFYSYSYSYYCSLSFSLLFFLFRFCVYGRSNESNTLS